MSLHLCLLARLSAARSRRLASASRRPPESAVATPACRLAIGRLHRAAAGLVLAAAGLAVHPARAQAPAAPGGWKPDRTVKLVVPYPAGGGTDAIARATARRLGEIWGQAVVVDNVSGANGLIGSQRVAQARPDGHTVLIQTPSIVLAKYLPGQKEADPLPRLRPVSAVLEYPNVIVASGKVPAHTWADFLAHCQAKPSCAFAAADPVTRLLGLQLREELGIRHLAVVPYRGAGGTMVTDLIADNVDFSIAGVTTALPHLPTGALTVLATLAPRRASALPTIPTVAEAGLPQLTSTGWIGLFAPRETPTAIVDAYADAMREAVRDLGVIKTIEAAGGTARAWSPKALGDLLAAEDRRLSALVARYPIE